jgi:hypothetical protein
VDGYVLEIIGWLGSALLVFSVLQSKFMRFRITNGIASAVLVAYNAALSVWPMVAVNTVLVIVDLYFIWALSRDKRQAKAFTYAEATPSLRQWFLDRFGADLERYHPGFAAQSDPETAVIFHQDRAVGLVAWRRSPGDAAELLADYVVPAYRDYAPGAYVYSATGPLRAAGLRQLTAEQPLPSVAAYLTALGFTGNPSERLTLTLT